MTIEHINLAPNTTEVEIGDYGKFTIRKFGAGEELELARIAREITELGGELDELENYKTEEKAKEGMEKVREYTKRLHEFHAEQFALLKAVVSAEDPKAVEKLFAENSIVDLFNTVGKVARG